MTILNVWIEEKKALILSDTKTQISTNEGITELSRSKVFPISHARYVVAARGEIDFAFTFAAFAMTRTETLDDALENFVSIIALANDRHLTTPTQGENSELALVGWSDSQKRMVGVLFAGKIGAGSSFDRSDITKPLMRPHLSNKGKLQQEPPYPKSDATRKAICQSQIASARIMFDSEYKAGRGAFGGMLLSVELDDHRIEVRQIGKV